MLTAILMLLALTLLLLVWFIFQSQYDRCRSVLTASLGVGTSDEREQLRRRLGSPR